MVFTTSVHEARRRITLSNRNPGTCRQVRTVPDAVLCAATHEFIPILPQRADAAAPFGGARRRLSSIPTFLLVFVHILHLIARTIPLGCLPCRYVTEPDMCSRCWVLGAIATMVVLLAPLVQAGSLHDAASVGDVDKVKRLLDKGARLNVRNIEGFAPLHVAAFTGHTEVVKLLIAAGAEVNVRDKYEQTPLLLAASEGQLNVVEVLISNGADVNARANNGVTPLKAAVAGHHGSVVALLERHGAKE